MTEPRKQRAEGAIETDSQRVPGSEDGGVIETDAVDARYGLFNNAEEYKMNNKRRGMALIFNHERFHEFLALEDRRGTYADMNNLRQRLSEQGFEVSCHDNLKNEDVYKIIKEASIADHSDADCFLCVFLSHGERNHIYSYDAKNEIQTLINMFKGDKCLTLLGKPKIFIIQACRGNKCDDPVIKRDASIEPQNKIQAEDAPGTTLPAGADFLMCYSAAEGFVSFRDETYGSWYIQDLCNTMKQCGSSLEMLELLTLVNRKVSARQVTDIRGRGKKQMPCFSSMLTKKLYLHPK